MNIFANKLLTSQAEPFTKEPDMGLSYLGQSLAGGHYQQLYSPMKG